MADDSKKSKLVSPENDPVETSVQSSAYATSQSSGQRGVDSSCSAGGNGATSSSRPRASPEQILEFADEMTERGLKAMKEKDHTAAILCFRRALNMRVSQYGKSAVKCCDAYHKYGRALYHKALERNPLAGRPPPPLRLPPVFGSDATDSALDLAWKTLYVARKIVETHPGKIQPMTELNILHDLAGVAEQKGDAESSVLYCGQLLRILEGQLEPDNTLLAVLMSNFLENCFKYDIAILYCEKAIFLCDSRTLKLLKKSLAILLSTPSLQTEEPAEQDLTSLSTPSVQTEEPAEQDLTSSSTPSLQIEEPAEQDLTPDEIEAEIRKAVRYAEKFKNQLQYLEYIALNPRPGQGNMNDRVSDILQGLNTSTIYSSHARLADQLEEIMPIPSTISLSRARLANQFEEIMPIPSTISSSHTRLANQFEEIMPIPSTISSSHTRLANQLEEIMPIPSTISSSHTRLANLFKELMPIPINKSILETKSDSNSSFGRRDGNDNGKAS